ncbi:MAG: dTMP kinase [Candidatus Micrarchaeia archaeon]|jgi:dTMP kinase
MLVAFEGIDGSGKATQIAKLTRHLKEKGKRAAVIAYPDMLGPLARPLGDVLHGQLELGAEAQFFLFFADILRDQMKDEGRLKQEMKAYDVVILDRYCLSTIAYQACKGMDAKKAEKIVEEAKPIAPDIVILLDIDPKAASSRKFSQKEPDKFEADLKFQECVRKGFLALAKKKFLCKNWAVVDAAGTPEAVAERVQAEIDRFIK